jgi:uroporphyrinogen decarboxylase
MNSKERVFATIEGKPTDCFAVTPYNGNFCINIAGYEVSECYLSGKKLAQAMIRAQEITGQDVVISQSDQYYITEAMGVKTTYSAGSLPDVVSRPVQNIKDISKLKPVSPSMGRMGVYIEAISRMCEHYQGEVAVRASGAGCFPLASHLMGMDDFLLMLAYAQMGEADYEKYLFDMMEVLYESHYRYVQACVFAGADIVQCADSLAWLDVISPAMYEKYAFPYEKKFFERIDKLKSDHDFYTLLHICGDNTLILQKMAETGCDIIEFDYKVSMAHCKKTIGDKVCLMGNLNPCGAMLDGTPKQVEHEARTAILDGGKNGGLCLGSGCEVAANAPLSNVKAMIDIGHSMKPDFE